VLLDDTDAVDDDVGLDFLEEPPDRIQVEGVDAGGDPANPYTSSESA
jgi:hypothetical protein